MADTNSTLAFEDALVISSFSREETDDTDNTDYTNYRDDPYDTDDTNEIEDTVDTDDTKDIEDWYFLVLCGIFLYFLIHFGNYFPV